MGSNTTSDDLKRAILEFTTNVVMDNSDAMQLGALANSPEAVTTDGDNKEKEIGKKMVEKASMH